VAPAAARAEAVDFSAEAEEAEETPVVVAAELAAGRPWGPPTLNSAEEAPSVALRLTLPRTAALV
jgi:hypothetical protein